MYGKICIYIYIYIPHEDIKRGSAEQLKTGATSGNLVTSETSHTYIGTVFIVKSVLYKEIYLRIIILLEIKLL
jgi:hypothetical protein